MSKLFFSRVVPVLIMVGLFVIAKLWPASHLFVIGLCAGALTYYHWHAIPKFQRKVSELLGAAYKSVNATVAENDKLSRDNEALLTQLRELAEKHKALIVASEVMKTIDERNKQLELQCANLIRANNEKQDLITHLQKVLVEKNEVIMNSDKGEYIRKIEELEIANNLLRARIARL